MIKRITDLEEMKRVVEVGDKIEVSDIGLSMGTGILVVDPIYNNCYNVIFENGRYGDTVGIKSLSFLLESYKEVWDNVVLIKEVPDEIKTSKDPYSDFEKSIGSKFKIYVEPCGLDCYCGEVTLLNFHPSQSIFLDKNEKLLIVEPKDIKYMRALKEIKSE